MSKLEEQSYNWISYGENTVARAYKGVCLLSLHFECSGRPRVERLYNAGGTCKGDCQEAQIKDMILGNGVLSS